MATKKQDLEIRESVVESREIKAKMREERLEELERQRVVRANELDRKHTDLDRQARAMEKREQQIQGLIAEHQDDIAVAKALKVLLRAFWDEESREAPWDRVKRRGFRDDRSDEQ